MAHPVLDDDTETPLDPAQLRLQAKLKRLLMWSTTIMALGLVAVIAAIFYRVYRTDAKPSTTFQHPLSAELPLPVGGRVIDTRLDGTRMAVTIETPKGAVVVVIDLETLQAIRRLELVRPE